MNSLDLIGNTPLIQLLKITGGAGKIFVKAEYLQPGGSVKDRTALQVVRDAYESGKLKNGQVVVEMTSGNMGAGLAFVCARFGNPFVAVMPQGNSPERLKILKALGAEIILTGQVDGAPGMVTGKDIQHATDVAKDLAEKRKGFYVDQFNNPSGIKAHYTTTGPEILKQLPDIDVFVAIIGSGGTFTGTSKFLKSTNNDIKCIAVEPAKAAILKTGNVDDAKHIIQGTGYSIVPPHWKKELADDIVTVTDEEVREMANRLSLEEGLYVGYSSGANVAAALKYLQSQQSAKNVATILCDSGYKYSDL